MIEPARTTEVGTEAPASRLDLMAQDATAAPPARLLVDAYRSHVDAMWKLVLRLGVEERDAEDVTHEVFMVAHRRWTEYDPARSVRPWLAGIACRVAADWRQAARVRREFLGVNASRATVDPGDGPLDVMTQEQERERASRLVLAALDGLSSKCREVLVLHELEEHPMPEVAALLGVSLNTLYSRLRIARARFRARIQLLLARGSER